MLFTKSFSFHSDLLCLLFFSFLSPDNEPSLALETQELPSPGKDNTIRGKAMTGPMRFSDTHNTEKPYFDDVSPRNVTAIVGQSAILHCRVKHLGQRTVSTHFVLYLTLDGLK